ncbi:MAG: NUDIX hydrolase [Candidatus Wildermuthbacteria bacterium]|nr:NUDIX hydrolase [Candidatus Wildermuthbacteria bacterium]
MGNDMSKIGVSQKVVILNGEGKLLTIRRSDTAPVRPLHWDLPGGDLDFGEDPIQGIIREITEETGLAVEHPEPFDVEAHVNSDGDFWVTIAYKVRCGIEDVKLSYEHDEFQWVAPEEFLQFKSAEKLQRFVQKLISAE